MDAERKTVPTTAVGEGVVRYIDGRPLLAFLLASSVGAQTVPSEYLDKVPLPAFETRRITFDCGAGRT